MRRQIWLAAAVLGAAAAACGGGGKKDTRAPAPDEGEEGGEPMPREDSFVSPEKYDEIAAAFRMKRPAVARCYSSAVESGKVDPKARGQVTLGVTISADGRPTQVKVTQSSLRSDAVEDCVVKMIKTWSLPAPEVGCDFSFSYEFEPE